MDEGAARCMLFPHTGWLGWHLGIAAPGEVQQHWGGLAAAVAAARVNSVKVEGLTVMLRRQKHHRLSWQEARRG